ncbi:hypothetical protein HCN44_009668 [Aphidius gifuensis]|uniref:Peptidase M16C associated domain-containing protein n=1 Tax=Aphidius gifuensis TaxID=684658 RepID=A0A835CZ43_APHGI|nr:uncharacterized protein C05D11.1-like [Aphidius gifuensis]KAF7998270.1 hypothetical protein HCN44_009668 [Aphidius gifuensis]
MAPVDNSPTSNMGDFELITSTKSNDTIPVHKYKSTKTGITVVIAEVDGPVVGGYFCIPTETFDNDGLPHTLEHLIFLGSEEFPYKGVLDLLGNRCLASGTNAWTDTDHTNYTMTTVGSEGFLSLMPIYLDHILFPILSDAGFLTEVHHINGDGEDAGVVYCEMQNRENGGEELALKELIRILYPGKCGYKSCTGGIMENLRESTSNEKVRAYHRDYYRPENLTIIITGKVQHAEVFKSLRSLEDKILKKGNRGKFERPWQSPVPEFKEEIESNILYPCDDEDNGLIRVGWRGPSGVSELYDLTGCSLLLKYLTDNSVSPLKKEFVEIDDPFACNVDFGLVENSVSLLYLVFSGVPIPKISSVKKYLIDVLNDIYNNENGIDMKRMSIVIHRHQLETLSNLENMPHDSIAFMLIGDALYGRNNKDLEQRLNLINDLKKLAKEPLSYWKNLLKRYLLDAPCGIVNAKPSIEKQKEIEASEKKRISERKEKLGKSGLEKAELELQNAIAQNEIEIPEELLTCVPVPGTDTINFHNVRSFFTGNEEQHSRFDVNKLPLYTCLDHVNTNFVYIFVVMDTSSLSKNLRPYLPLILEAIGECPIERDGKLIPYEDIVAEIESDTIAVGTKTGFDNTSRYSCGIFSHNITLILQIEMSKYNKGIQWIKELLYDTKFTVERLKIISQKMINEITQLKKQGNGIVKSLMKGLMYDKDSNHFNASPLRQQQFLTELIERLSTDDGQKQILNDVEEIRKILTDGKNIMCHIASNVDKLSNQVTDLYTPWDILKIGNIEKKMLEVIPDWKLLKPYNEIKIKGSVLGLGCVDSAYSLQCAPCINDYKHQDLPTLLVCLQYLTQLEGPMWKQVRGQGLSYSYKIFASPNEGLIYLTFFGATNIVGAYKETKKIIDSHLKEKNWEKILYETAKASLIFQIVDREASVGDVVSQSILSYFKNVSHDYNRQMVQKVHSVDINDLDRVANKYLKPLFDPEQCKASIVCHPSKVTEVSDAFKSYSQNLEVYTSLESSYLNDW